jgi:hypothetical protein
MNECRLCGGSTKHLWNRLTLARHDVAYFECESCGSLQTETPYWLDDAYAVTGIWADTGACQRSFDSALMMSTVLQILEFPQEAPCLDYGAGLGLFGRLMRDRGWSYFAYDKYSTLFYMDAFVATPASMPWSLVSAFEVFEHFTNPAESLAEILEAASDYVFFTTDLWRGQGRGWDYLAPIVGQHVFFYTLAALDLTGRKHGFEFHDFGFVKCFARAAARDRVSQLLSDDFRARVMATFWWHQQKPYQYATRDSANLIAATGGEVSPAKR